MDITKLRKGDSILIQATFEEQVKGSTLAKIDVNGFEVFVYPDLIQEAPEPPQGSLICAWKGESPYYYERSLEDQGYWYPMGSRHRESWKQLRENFDRIEIICNGIRKPPQ